jgi:16S rRNA C967 or C1407 C5-methylase (RsmB/RsmF family)/NOL1/NOP2/fmu family ribosome biogenesis protein
MTLPLAFTNRMQSRLKNDWDAFLQALQSAPPVSIRINPCKKYTHSFQPVPWTEFGYYLPERPLFTLDPLLHAGAYYVQEASSMLLEQAIRQSVNLNQKQIALDLCAAPGGKSTHLLTLLNDESLLVSNEVIKSRASVLSENIQKWGYPNVMVTNNDPADFGRLSSFFDLIVIDAPCSGEGLFRRDGNAAQEWSEENVQLCAKRQQRIVMDAWPALKENGILIYSTCTYSEWENEENLKWLSDTTELEFVPLKLNKEWGVEEVNHGKAIGYQCYPHKVKGEGFFVSVIRKTSAEKKMTEKSRTSFPKSTKKVTDSLKEWCLPSYHHELIQFDDLIVSIPSESYSEINLLSQLLKPIVRGTALATQKHDKFIPEHAFAISTAINQSHFTKIEVSLEEALTYLRKNALTIGEGKRGFGLLAYQNVPLGWVNLLGNRVNNLYPSNWRILMK